MKYYKTLMAVVLATMLGASLSAEAKKSKKSKTHTSSTKKKGKKKSKGHGSNDPISSARGYASAATYLRK